MFSTCSVAVHAISCIYNVPRFHCCITALPEVGSGGGEGGRNCQIICRHADQFSPTCEQRRARIASIMSRSSARTQVKGQGAGFTDPRSRNGRGRCMQADFSTNTEYRELHEQSPNGANTRPHQLAYDTANISPLALLFCAPFTMSRIDCCNLVIVY